MVDFGSLLTILTTKIVCVFFLTMVVTQPCHAPYTTKTVLFAQLIFGPVTALKWLQVTFLTFKPIMGSFRSIHFTVPKMCNYLPGPGTRTSSVNRQYVNKECEKTRHCLHPGPWLTTVNT